MVMNTFRMLVYFVYTTTLLERFYSPPVTDEEPEKGSQWLALSRERLGQTWSV